MAAKVANSRAVVVNRRTISNASSRTKSPAKVGSRAAVSRAVRTAKISNWGFSFLAPETGLLFSANPPSASGHA